MAVRPTVDPRICRGFDVATLKDDIDFLNDGFIGRLWPVATEVIRTQVLHDVWHDVEDIGPIRLDVGASGLTVEPPPHFEESGRAILGLRFTRGHDGPYEFRGRLHVVGVDIPWITRFGVTATFWLSLDFDEDGPLDPRTGVEVSTGRRGRLFARLSGNSGWREETQGTIEKRVEDELGFLLQASHDPPDARPEPELVQPAATDDVPSAFNLVLVGDRFDGPDERRDFDAIVAAVARELASPTASGATEPLHSFKSAVRLWRVDLAGPERPVVESFEDGASSRKVAFGNLARLAAVGRRADELGPNVVVWLAHRDQFPATPRTRAMAMGGVVLMPTQPVAAEGDPDPNVHLLLHELGHTIFGDLADEYDGTDPGTDVDDLEPRHRDYRGPDPAAPNLAVRQGPTSSPGQPDSHPFPAWRRWLDETPTLPEWDHHGVTAEQGGGYHPKGIWRPAHECKMRDSRSPVPFCAVCREAMTRRMRRVLGEDWFVVEVAHPDADRDSERVVLRADDGLVHRVAAPEQGTEDVAVSLVSGTLPEPWEVQAQLAGAGSVRESRDHRARVGQATPVTTWRFPAQFGDELEIAVVSRCLFTPWDRLPDFTLSVRCDLPLREETPPRAPERPTDLAVSGATSSGAHVTLEASSEDPNGDPLRVEFEVLPRAVDLRGRVDARSDWLQWRSDGPVRARVRHRIEPDGAYHFRARAVDRGGRRSRWSSTETFRVRRTGGGGPGSGRGSGSGGKVGGGGTGGIGGDGPGEGGVQPP